MFDLENLIICLNHCPPERISIAMFCISLIAVFGFLRAFGQMGLYVFLALAVILGNIQVLKAVKFSWFDEPIALGTIVFSTTYLCTDILTEYYGPDSARRAVWMSFSSMLCVSMIMVLTMGWAPLPVSTFGPDYDRFREAHEAIKTLFLPAPAILSASLIAYVLSQYNDIWIFHSLKKITQGRYAGARAFIATAVSSLLDSIIFSVLAWVVFAPIPMPADTLVKTYILGTYGLRLALAALNAPMVRCAKFFIPRGSHV